MPKVAVLLDLSFYFMETFLHKCEWSPFTSISVWLSLPPQVLMWIHRLDQSSFPCSHSTLCFAFLTFFQFVIPCENVSSVDKASLQWIWLFLFFPLCPLQCSSLRQDLCCCISWIEWLHKAMSTHAVPSKDFQEAGKHLSLGLKVTWVIFSSSYL